MRRISMALAVAIAPLTLAAGCVDAPTEPGEPTAAASRAPAAMMNSNAPFKAWHQGFNHGTDGWFDETSPGELGWCGSIHRVDRRSGDVTPSAGSGYAVVETGDCVTAWAVFEPSGPYSPGAGYSTEWPTGGYVQELDIHLDPGWADGTGFTYVASFNLLDGGGLRYFFTPVTRTGGALTVGDFEVTDAGWYTFRHVFSSDEGALSARFELTQGGRTLMSEPLGTTAFTGEATSDFQASNVGSGYIWFDSYPASFFGTQFFQFPDLPIDEHRVRRGS